MKASFVPVLPTRRSHEGTIFAGAADPCIGVACVQRQTDEHALPLDQVRAIAVAASVPSYCLLVALTTSIILFTSLVYLIYLLANLESNALEKKTQHYYTNFTEGGRFWFPAAGKAARRGRRG